MARAERGVTMVRAGAIALTICIAGPAAAACLPPTPPDATLRPVKPVPPEKSACAGARPGTPGCLGWEPYSYNDAVKAYNAKVPDFLAAATTYVAKLNAFVAAASDYAKCEAGSLQ